MISEIIQEFIETKVSGLPLFLLMTFGFSRQRQIKEAPEDVPGDNFPQINL